MTDRTENAGVEPVGDLELLVQYYNEQLDAERVDQVRRRLEDDPEFREFAAPLLLAWSVPRHLERHPRPQGELEKHWDEFTRRAGFAHQRRVARRRRLWFLMIFLAVVGVTGFVQRGAMLKAYQDFRDFEPVHNDTGWVTLRDSNEVLLAPGARLRSSKRLVEGGVHRVRLAGSARFRVNALDTANALSPVLQPLAVETRAGVAFSGFGEFTVTTRGDTTDVEVHRPSRRRFFGFVPMPTHVLVQTHDYPNPMTLGETQAARLVRRGRAERTKQ